MRDITGKPDSDAGASRLLGRYGALLVLAGLVAAALPLIGSGLAHLAKLTSYPYPQDGLEGTLLDEARLLWSGQPLYQPLERLRFVSAPYPPLHPVLLGLADRLPGPHVFWGGRLISLASALAISILILLLGRRVGGSWLGAALGVALFLSAPPVLLWATRIKPDLLALLFTTLGLFVATRLTTDDRRPTIDQRPTSKDQTLRTSGALSRSTFFVQWAVPALCFALAFFTKQTAVAAALATGLALLIDDVRGVRDGRFPSAGYAGPLPVRWRTIAFGLAYAFLVLGGSALLDALTRGQYTAHVWGLHRSEWWTTYLLLKFVALLAPYWPAMLIAAALLLRALRGGRGLVIACYALVVPISMLGAGETGANTNHLLETLLALSLATGSAAGWMAETIGRALSPAFATSQPSLEKPSSQSPGAKSQAPSFTRYSRIWAAAIFILLAAQLALAYRPQEWYTGELAPTDAPARFLELIRATPGEILADDVGLLVAAGRPLRYDDPSTMGPAARSGVWDQSGLIQEIAERKFSAIMLPINLDKQSVDASGRWTTEVLAAIRAHYRLAYRDVIFTYVPR